MAKQCINCANDINSGAMICPYCHLRPYVFGDKEPYQSQDVTPSVGAGIALLGMPVCLINPFVGGAMMVGGTLLHLFGGRKYGGG